MDEPGDGAGEVGAASVVGVDETTAPLDEDGTMPAALTVGPAAAWIRRSPGGLRLAIARGLLGAEQRRSPLQPRPFRVIQGVDLLDYEERMAERGAKRGPKSRRR